MAAFRLMYDLEEMPWMIRVLDGAIVVSLIQPSDDMIGFLCWFDCLFLEFEQKIEPSMKMEKFPVVVGFFGYCCHFSDNLSRIACLSGERKVVC